MSSLYSYLSTKLHLSLISTFIKPRVSAPGTYTPVDNKQVTVIIPTYKPKGEIYGLIWSVLTGSDMYSVLLVNDHTPDEQPYTEVIAFLKELSARHNRVTYLCTPTNLRKPGAINYGFTYLTTLPEQEQPDVVIT